MNGLKARWLTELAYIAVGCAVVWSSLWLYGRWDQYRRSQTLPAPGKSLVENGSLLSLEGVNFATSPVSLIIVSSPVCRYCLASKEFHTKLIASANAAGIPAYVVIPSLRGSSQYLKEISVTANATREYRQMNLFVSGTPTILAIDGSGRVRDTWSGFATPADQSEIANLLKTHSFSADSGNTRIDAPNLQPAQLTDLESTIKLDVIDVRERDKANSVSNSTNIPLLELPYRAPHELDITRLQVVDCENVLWNDCDSAVKTLKELRFNTVTLGAGTYHKRCRITPFTG